MVAACVDGEAVGCKEKSDGGFAEAWLDGALLIVDEKSGVLGWPITGWAVWG